MPSPFLSVAQIAEAAGTTPAEVIAWLKSRNYKLRQINNGVPQYPAAVADQFRRQRQLAKQMAGENAG